MNLEELMRKGWSPEIERPTPIYVEPEPEIPNPLTVRIEFDGGARHVPGIQGYGMGYGSFRYNGSRPVRLEFNRLMSANAAEIWTLSAAVNRICNEWSPEDIHLDVWGDSQIAIKWCLIMAKEKAKLPFTGKSTLSKGSSEEMKNSISSMEILSHYASVMARWHSRTNSLRVFGH